MMNHIGTNTIETKRLILRRFVQDDAESMKRNWVADPAVQNGYGEPTYITIRQIHDLLDVYIGKYKNDDYYRFGIFEKESTECIGQIAFFLVDVKNHFAEIEYCIGRAFQRRGYATEAARAVIDYGFDKIHLHKVQICHRESNFASGKVIDKCGLYCEGMLRDYFYLDGKYEGRKYYSMLENERPQYWHLLD